MRLIKTLLLLLTVFAWSTEGHQEYYSTVRFVETPLSYLAGSVPISREQALNRNHYRFDYDGQNRLIQVAFFNGRRARDPNHTANLFVLAHKMTFSYSDSTETISFFDRHGNERSVLGDCYRFRYLLDTLGHRKSLVFLDSSGKRIQNDWDIFVYNWTFEAGGSVIEERFDQQGNPVSMRPGFEFYRTRFRFNAAGDVALLQNINENGELVENASGAAQDEITTNAQGNFLQWRVLDRNGHPEKGNAPDVAIGIQSFDKYGYETSLEHRDEDGRRMYTAYGLCRGETRYDRWGNILERAFFDEGDNPALHKNAGYHRLKLFWSRDGNHRQKIEYYDLNGQLINHKSRGYAIATYKHDRRGNLVEINYFDQNNRPVNRSDSGIARVLYDYNESGKRLRSRSFNTDGAEL